MPMVFVFLLYSSVDYVAKAFWFLLFFRCLKATVMDLLISIWAIVLGGTFHLICDGMGVFVWFMIFGFTGF